MCVYVESDFDTGLSGSRVCAFVTAMQHKNTCFYTIVIRKGEKGDLEWWRGSNHAAEPVVNCGLDLLAGHGPRHRHPFCEEAGLFPQVWVSRTEERSDGLGCSGVRV